MPLKIAEASFTRPADTTAYAAADLVANSTTAGSVAAMSFAIGENGVCNGRIKSVTLFKTNATVTNAQFKVHFFNASPAVTNGDNGAFSPTLKALWLGSFNVTSATVATDGSAGRGVATTGAGSDMPYTFAGSTIYALMEALAAYTPTSAEVFTLRIEYEPSV